MVSEFSASTRLLTSDMWVNGGEEIAMELVCRHLEALRPHKMGTTWESGRKTYRMVVGFSGEVTKYYSCRW
jgi:hypothetical protein